MNAEIIAVGSELLTGATENTNTTFLVRHLTLMGYDVNRTCVIGDVKQDIIDAVRLAVSRSRLTILTGGLGPTDDDMTKEAVAEAFGFQLVPDDAVEAAIRAYYLQKKMEMPKNNLKQALVIKGGESLKNAVGIAPGIFLQGAEQAVALLPGPPREMEPMFLNELVPLLSHFNNSHIATATLRVFGISESELEEKVKELLYGENPSAALYAKTGEVHINIAAHGDSDEAAGALLAAHVKKFKKKLGEYIYSEDDKELNETVVKLLKETGIKIAVAESCTGGLLASRITDIAGSSGIFEYGVSAYADWVKQESLAVNASVLRKYTAISSVTAAEMAKGAYENGKADIGVGITGLAGPSKGEYIDKPIGLVYIAVADSERVIVKKFNFNASMGRGFIREMCVKNAFDMIRRFVMGFRIEGAREFDEGHIADMDREGRPKSKASLAVEKGMVLALFALVVAGSVFLGYRAIRERIDANVYSTLVSSYSETASDGAKTQISFTDLSERNPDTVGWLWTPSLEIDNVVVGGRSNDYYVNHDFTGHDSTLGCLHVDEAVDVAASPDNTVVFGNSADVTQMFGPLLKLANLESIVNNYGFTFETDTATNQYVVVSVFYANTNPTLGEVQSFYRTSVFATGDDFTDFVVEAKMRSVINVDIDIKSGDSFLTLVTDTSDWTGSQLVVIARRVREGESAELDITDFSKNMAPLYPEAWHKLNNTASLVNEVVERDKWKSWLLVNEGAAVSVDAVTPSENSGDTADSPDTSGKTITVMLNGAETTDSPLNIVSKMVAGAMSSDFNDEALKAQAVACISWLRYSYYTTGAPAVTGSTPSEHIKELVASVLNECMYFGDNVAYTPYFPMAAGKTNACDEVYPDRGAFPYLISVDSVYDSYLSGYSKTASFTQSALKTRLETYYKITLSENYQNWIQIIDYTSGGYAKNVSIDGQLTTTGAQLCLDCLGIQSACFTSYWSGTSVSFTSKGSGSGVGMSQNGANQYAKRDGWDYHAILSHYYPGVTFGTLEW